MGGYLDGVVPPLTREELYEGVWLFNAQCLSLGITALQDATPGNSPERWRLFEDVRERGLLTPELTLMAGAAHLPDFLREGFAFGHESQRHAPGLGQDHADDDDRVSEPIDGGACANC